MQDDLFVNEFETINISFNQSCVGQVQLHQKAFTQQAELWMEHLIHETPWEQGVIQLANKTTAIPRLQCWYGDNNAYYQYSGITLSPKPWTPLLTEIKQQVEKFSGQQFNSVLINCYRNGEDSVSWHADNEPELGKDPVIASLSLGQQRTFSIKSNHAADSSVYHLTLHSGALLIMGPSIQRHCLHAVLKDRRVRGLRINLTFRQIMN